MVISKYGYFGIFRKPHAVRQYCEYCWFSKWTHCINVATTGNWFSGKLRLNIYYNPNKHDISLAIHFIIINCLRLFFVINCIRLFIDSPRND